MSHGDAAPIFEFLHTGTISTIRAVSVKRMSRCMSCVYFVIIRSFELYFAPCALRTPNNAPYRHGTIYNTTEKLPIRQWRVSRKCNINRIKYSACFLKQGTILRRTCARCFLFVILLQKQTRVHVF